MFAQVTPNSIFFLPGDVYFFQYSVLFMPTSNVVKAQYSYVVQECDACEAQYSYVLAGATNFSTNNGLKHN